MACQIVNFGTGSMKYKNIFKDLLQQCDVISFTAEKTVFKNEVSLQKCLAGDRTIYAQRAMFSAS